MVGRNTVRQKCTHTHFPIKEEKLLKQEINSIPKKQIGNEYQANDQKFDQWQTSTNPDNTH